MGSKTIKIYTKYSVETKKIHTLTHVEESFHVFIRTYALLR